MINVSDVASPGDLGYPAISYIAIAHDIDIMTNYSSRMNSIKSYTAQERIPYLHFGFMLAITYFDIFSWQPHPKRSSHERGTFKKQHKERSVPTETIPCNY